MDKTITTDDLANRTDSIFEDVKSGESFVVTSNGQAVGRIVPTASSVEAEKTRKDAAWKALLEHLDQQPALNLGPWSRDEAYE
ncbi:MAG TPA: type II toxin-antitoxin system prevent-host-death family antitoxin [Rhizomicrobium sp.]|jgi:prevent-host-death family protein